MTEALAAGIEGFGSAVPVGVVSSSSDFLPVPAPDPDPGVALLGLEVRAWIGEVLDGDEGDEERRSTFFLGKIPSFASKGQQSNSLLRAR